jgi:serine/threonine protein kinase
MDTLLKTYEIKAAELEEPSIIPYNLLKDYSEFLLKSGLVYYTKNPYLFVTSEIIDCEWAIYISVIKKEFEKLFHILLPILVDYNLSFSIPENSEAHTQILDGSFGLSNVGKVITLYAKDNTTTSKIANLIIEITTSFSGVEVPFAHHLAGCVYTENLKSPKDINTWPFSHIKKPVKQIQKKKIKNYLLVNQIKGDAKGNVYKSLNLKNWFNIQWCIVKEGKLNQCSDYYGRTIKDRLQWQFELLTKLSGLAPLPKALDFFMVGGDAYLVIEYIKGNNLNDQITSLQQGNIWRSLETVTKRRLVRYILEILYITESLHIRKIVHRDINPGNFMVKEDDTITAIDIELAYDFNQNPIAPPFSYGTAGYMSPQQQNLLLPEIADDIYGLGALIVKIMTGISPGKFNNSQQLFHQLNFFIGNTAVTSMIANCMNHNHANRPEIKSIRHTIEVYDALLLTNQDKVADSMYNLSDFYLRQTIQTGLNALGGVMLDCRGKWQFKSDIPENNISNELKSYQPSSGFANGSSGVLYLFAKAEILNFDLVDLHQLIMSNYEDLKNSLPTKVSIEGLFSGNLGVAIAINELIFTGLLEDTIFNTNLIYQLASSPVTRLSIANGIAGKGLIYLKLSQNPHFPSRYDDLCQITAILIKEQNKDGSWNIKRDDLAKGVKLFGFNYGIAGIVYFLIEFNAKYEDSKVSNAIIKALDYLLKVRKESNGKLVWTISSINGNFDPWLEHGFSGVALTFIKAYQLTNDLKYREVAEYVLFSHPKYISSNYLTLSNGLAGLGEVYLEAYKIFKNQEWRDRAAHIAALLMHTSRASNSETYWLDGNLTIPNPGLMDGNTGILHFLMHFSREDKIDFFFN